MNMAELFSTVEKECKGKVVIKEMKVKAEGLVIKVAKYDIATTMGLVRGVLDRNCWVIPFKVEV